MPKPPSHPGLWLWSELIEPMNVSITELAERMGLHRSHLSALINGRINITADLAFHIAPVIGVRAEDLLARQAGYDLAMIRYRLGASGVRTCPPKRRNSKGALAPA